MARRWSKSRSQASKQRRSFNNQSRVSGSQRRSSSSSDTNRQTQHPHSSEPSEPDRLLDLLEPVIFALSICLIEVALWPTRAMAVSNLDSGDGAPGLLFYYAFPLGTLVYFWIGLKDGVNWGVGDPSSDPWGERRWRMSIGQTVWALVLRCIVLAYACFCVIRLSMWMWQKRPDAAWYNNVVWSLICSVGTVVGVVPLIYDAWHQLGVKREERAAKLRKMAQ
ncbi:hypothetical protein B0T19DRAFT_446091 [Cercophora scortea]|uniref:Uncharacterized protein n=1 Tax=Cercophora scortea TaxID=314031 RepID=A0AAE0M5M8_9PEZI|nr:hypothetical protein B0T19DRAFT_446091 [Cercophora scortea]